MLIYHICESVSETTIKNKFVSVGCVIEAPAVQIVNNTLLWKKVDRTCEKCVNHHTHTADFER